jgi:tRNA(Ile)-lysidine synthase
LAGIPARRDRLIRPLLCVGRDEVEAYLRRRAVPSVQDASNRDRRFARVRVRLDVLPLLRTLNPRVEEALARLADNARAEAGGFASPPLTRGHLGALANLLARGGGTSWLSLPGDRRAEVRIVSGRAPVGLPPIDLEIPGFGRHPVPEAAATVSLRPDRRRPRGGEAGWFDARALAFPLRLRTRRAGDRIALPGGTKKVSDLLIDAKVPRRDRDRTLLLCDAARVLWVAGVRQAAGTWPSGSVGVEARLRVVEAPGRKIGARR